jgi:glycosyltransferase involved in cell wall biosynthesis
MSSKPKILFLVNEAFFFISHRLAVAKAAQESGFDVHVAAPDDHVWAPADFDVEVFSQLGMTFHAIPLTRRGTNPFEEISTILALYRLFRALSPDLVHLLTIKPVLYGGIIARLCDVPASVIAITGLGQVFSGKGMVLGVVRASVKLLYRLATGHSNARVIVQNPEDGQRLLSEGIVTEDRLVLIRGSGVSIDNYGESADPGDEPVAILPARLIWDKGILVFVEAAKILKARGVRCRLALVGDSHASNPRAVPEETLRGFAGDGVEWWGRRDDMPEVFASVHIVVLPSSYGEGVPKVLIEAAASGRPIIATDIPGCREIVRDGENGFLIPVDSSSSLADALEKLATDMQLRQRMGKRGRQIAVSEFDERQVAKTTLGIYEKLLSS